MKEYKHIEALLERYFDGQTTETEEQTLKRLLDETEVPAHLQTERERCSANCKNPSSP